MLGERVRVRLGAELVQQLRRALDVGEEEGDGAGGEIAPHGDRIVGPHRPVQQGRLSLSENRRARRGKCLDTHP